MSNYFLKISLVLVDITVSSRPISMNTHAEVSRVESHTLTGLITVTY